MATVLLTGASAGIGRATADALTGRGHEVWGTARQTDRLPSMVRFHPVALDLSAAGSLPDVVRAARDEAGGFDVLINNAGEAVFGALEELPQASLEAQFQTLVLGPLALVRELLPELRARRGLIVNVSSLAARLPIPFMGPYSAAKAALSALTWSLQLELEGQGVRISEVQPGDINTGFHRAMTRPDGVGSGSYARAAGQVLARNECSMRASPPPERVAAAIAKLVDSGSPRHSPLVVGDFFQSRLVPLGLKCLPDGLMRILVKRYYRL